MKLPELDRLLVSKSGHAAGNFKTIVFALIGVYTLGFTAWRYFAQGITTNALYNIIIGVMCFFVLKYEKLVYVSPVGIVKETHTWFSHHREVLKWSEVKFVTIMHKRKESMVFLERDTLGWKVLFGLEQIPELKTLFAKYIPSVEVDEMAR